MAERELGELLVCPTCRGELAEKAEGLACRRCGGFYRVENGIPIMLAGEKNK